MTLHGALCTLRPWRLDDVAALTELANDRDVVRFVTRRFPSPYTRADAEAWIRLKLGDSPVLDWAIEHDGMLAGGIGVTPGTHERSGTVMVGYWLGKRFWGRGIATDALRAVTAHALATLRPHRMWANVFADNAASARVLEKAGYVREAVLARSLADRDGAPYDELIFVLPQTDAELT
ncbi:MAG TPA: GNAT family N-acetyltransferase [Candidatus Elarobacter sp.]|jgi:RimJ/RimL family protein N-acetyltransferase